MSVRKWIQIFITLKTPNKWWIEFTNRGKRRIFTIKYAYFIHIYACSDENTTKTVKCVNKVYVHSPRKSGSRIKFLSSRHICLVLIFATTNFLSLRITRDRKYQFYVGPGIKMASNKLKMSLTLFADTRPTSE